jgi:hypothetical protein
MPRYVLCSYPLSDGAETDGQDRKQILQQLRKHVKAISTDGDAQMVLFTAFDCVE